MISRPICVRDWMSCALIKIEKGETAMRYWFAALGLLCAVGLSPARAQDKEFNLKFSSWVPPAHPLNPSLIAWGKDIEKDTGGTVRAFSP
jgi:hypothetical protein